jgi:hypothetical protein
MNTWLTDESPTERTITPAQRQQLQAASPTRKLADFRSELKTAPFAGNALFQSHTTLILALIGTELVLPIVVTGRMTMGRYDLEMDEKAHLDLMPYGGQRAGVSRMHAVLYRTQHTISLADLGSTNGTYLNGMRLVPHQPRLLREGDEIRLGNMQFHVSFGK